MGKYLNPSNRGFQIARYSEIYVDKTGLISYTNRVLDTEQRYICVSRPRRFGKSMTAEMLCAYYSKGCESKKLFQDLTISKDQSFHTHLNQYNVLFLNMQRFLSRAEDPNNLIFYLQKVVLSEIKEVYKEIVCTQEEHLATALENIFEKTQMGFLFIIDEWDCIFRENRYNIEAQTKYLDFLRDLLKDQTYVKLAYMTGILPIKKYGTHSALNIFREFSMTEPKRLAEYIGFTEQEVEDLCVRYDMDFSEAKRWYDGYQFRRISHIYNPKSVVDAMLDGEFHSYWSSTETYEALKVYINMNFDGLKDAIIMMLGGAYCKVNIGTFTNDMVNFEKKDDVLTLLIHLGYLAYKEETREVFIPNEEIRGEFINAIEGANWNNIIKMISDSENLLENT